MKFTAWAWIALLALGAPATALAYLDPGTGSMLLQVILGGVAAATVALKLYWHRIKQALGLAKPDEGLDDPEPPSPSE